MLNECVALIADDNEDNRNICRIILQKSNMSVTEVVNGQQAIERLTDQRFTLMVLDMQMPVVDGRGVLQWLTAHSDVRPQHVIVLTANPHRVTHDVQNTADYVMYKPIAAVEFAHFVQRLTQPRKP